MPSASLRGYMGAIELELGGALLLRFPTGPRRT
jgi:hypothetical protein